MVENGMYCDCCDENKTTGAYNKDTEFHYCDDCIEKKFNLIILREG